jgi:hypothetical protein
MQKLLRNLENLWIAIAFAEAGEPATSLELMGNEMAKVGRPLYPALEVK